MAKAIVGIIITTYNDEPEIINACLRSCYEQRYEPLHIVCVDGSPKPRKRNDMGFLYSDERLQFVFVPNGERSVTRELGVRVLQQTGVDYFLFLDSDMTIPNPHFIEQAVQAMIDTSCSGLVFKEHAYSNYSNFWTRVKVFERNLYQAGSHINRTSIEAARMWCMDQFPSFVPDLNAFEEIQPTLRCIEQGGVIIKHPLLKIHHNEKHVTFNSLLRKKKIYFRQMGTHHAVKWQHMITRFYLFRMQLYHPGNILKYIRHPILAISTLLLYLLLSVNGVSNILIKQTGVRKKHAS